LLSAIECPAGDLNGDFEVDLKDMSVFSEDWLTVGYPKPGLVGYWKLDENRSSRIAVDGVSTNDGFFKGNPVWASTEENQDGVVIFDGVDDYVEMAGYKGVTGTGSRTVTAWICTDNANNLNSIVSWGGDDAGLGWLVGIHSDGTIEVSAIEGFVRGSTVVTDGQWHHIAAVLVDDGSPNISEVKIFVDGQNDTHNSVVPVVMNTASDADVKIGAWLGAETRYFKGILSDVCIYERALGAGEIEIIADGVPSVLGNSNLNNTGGVDISDFSILSNNWAYELYPVDAFTPLYEKAAEHILSQVESDKGYCLVFGAGEGRLAYELATHSSHNIIGVESSSAKVNAARSVLHKSGIYGDRITLQKGSLDSLKYRDYAAVLVVSDSIIESGVCTGSAAEMFRMVRPDGGVAIVGQPAGCPNVLSRMALESWLDSASLTYTITDDSNGLWAKVERGPLPGAGEWTHMWGDLGNTACSGDTRMKDAFNVLWFGEPGPGILIDRHWRPMAPLYKSGRFVIPGNNQIVCLDAYNGARLWDIKIPNSARIAILRDAGWLALGDDYLYAAVENACHKIIPDTGVIEETYYTQTADADWGYVAIDGDLLFGSRQKAGASRLAVSYYDGGKDGNQISRKDNQPTVVSTGLFCLDRLTGDQKWLYENSSVIANPTICIGDGHVYFFESIASAAVTDPDGQVAPTTFCSGDNEYLVKLNKNTGEVVWREQHNLPFANIIYLSYKNGIVLASGCTTGASKFRYHYRAINADDGVLAWQKDWDSTHNSSDKEHGGQDKHPLIVGDTVYLKFGSYNLQTGASIGFTYSSSNCAEFSASQTHLFGRNSGNPSIYSLSGSGGSSRLCSAMRPGCYISIIPAGGMIMLPAYSAGCTCGYTIQTSIGWLPR